MEKEMAILTVNHVEKHFGETVIITDIQFEIQENHRVGLVGVNGSGKTTLFRVITGEYEPDQGTVILAKNAKLGYMEQHVCNDPTKTAFTEVLTVFDRLLTLEGQLEALNARLSDPALSPAALDALILKQTALQEAFVDGGGLTCRGRTRSTLLGLGFTEAQLNNPVRVLSGGQKAKLQLAKLLLSGATLLLLDEPTNHLDIAAVEWLEQFLLDYKGAYLVISHDRYFLDKVTNRTFELSHLHLTAYKGNYSSYVKLRQEARLAQQRVYDGKIKEIKRIEGIIEQQKRWNQARNYVTIASKQKQIDRIAADLTPPETDPAAIHFQFHASRRSGDEVLAAADLALSFGETPLFHGVNLTIRRGEKVFLIGPNGCGKTSLLKILLNQYQATAGSFALGVGVDPGYYQQSQSGLCDEKSVIDEVWDCYPRMNQTQVRSALAVFLFRGEEVFKPVAALSGGERARLLLLKLMLSSTNFLLLDEPTNHLDIGAREALEATLTDYDGTLLVVSHDRYLINKLADRIYYLDADGTTAYPGNYDDFLAAQALERERTQALPAPVSEAPPPNSYKRKKAHEAKLRKARAALNRLEREIEENDRAVEALTETLHQPDSAADYALALSTSQALEDAQKKAEALMGEWTGYSEEIEALEALLG